MLQLTYTSCRPGMSLNGSGGYTVRAASAMLDQAWLAYAPQLARYEVACSSRGAAGARLAFHRRQNAAVLTHSLSVRDHEARPASFTHAVIDPTGQLGPIEAIGMWESPFWKCADDDEGTTELPIVEALPANSLLNWASLQRRLQDERFYAIAEFLLTAWLRRMNRSIVLLADSESVAAAVWLITRCLPASALRDLSFATQDHDPATAGVAVVGYGCPTKSLPTQVLADRHWFDACTGKCSGDGVDPYAKFICREILASRWPTVETFLGLCDDLRIDSAEDIDLAHRVIHESHVCTEQELLQVKDRPRLLRWLLQDQRHAQMAVTILARGTSVASQSREALVAAFSETPERTQSLVSSLLEQAGAALDTQDLQRAVYLVGLCEGTNGSPDPSALWERAVEQAAGDRLAIETRLGLAEILNGLGHAIPCRNLVTRLLDVPIEDLPVVLRCAAHPSLKAEACRMAVDGCGAMPPATIKALSGQPDVVVQLLRIASDPTAIASVLAASKPAALLDILIVDHAVRSRIDIDAVIDYALKAGKLDLLQLATIDFAPYWEILLHGRHADQIIGEMLRCPATHYSGREVMRCLQTALSSASTSPAVAGAIHRRTSLLEALSVPSAPLYIPEDIMAAINELPQSDRRTVALQLLPRLAQSVANATPATLCNSLQELMELAVSQAQCGTAAALREFAKAALANDRLLTDASVATIVVAYAFGVIGCQPANASARDQLVDLGVDLIILYARAGGPLLNRHVDEQAMRWPEPARSLFRLARQRHRINGHVFARLARSRAALTER